MKVTIIGWYGTETIGDRAILAGLISFFNKSFGKFEIKLGSLFPFFSERTLNEDYSFYKEIIGNEVDINLFNSKNAKELTHAIAESDLVVMGGGPLMDLSELFMVEYAFKKAKKMGIKTALLGCGIGPLFQKKYRKAVLNISLHTDIHILRDTQSKKYLSEIYSEFNQEVKAGSVYASFDPAVECCLEYKVKNKKLENNYIAINLREFPLEYNADKNAKNINYELKEFVKKIAHRYSDREIKLVPMHYFHVGGDDRAFLNQIALELALENIAVQQENLTLQETISVYSNAYFNIGMRFHAVVLQTIASGRNYVLDYTEPRKGKINGFLQDIDNNGFYSGRYLSLQEDLISTNIITNEAREFEFNERQIRQHLDIYIDLLKKVML